MKKFVVFSLAAIVMFVAGLVLMVPGKAVGNMVVDAAGISDNPVIINLSTVDSDGDGYTFASVFGTHSVITITEDGYYVITSNDPTSGYSRSIVISSGITAHLTLNNVKIYAPGGYGNTTTIPSIVASAFSVGSTAKLYLNLVGANTVSSNSIGTSLSAIGFHGIGVAGELIIDGTGSLEVGSTNGQANNATWACGIGGNGKIVILGGTITATGRYGGAGIGGDAAVEIHGGTVNANAAGSGTIQGAGIGGTWNTGTLVDAGNVTITGGNVIATGRIAIGGNGGYVNISGGVVNANVISSINYVGIGGAINLSGGEVTSVGVSGGVGVQGNLTVTGGTHKISGSSSTVLNGVIYGGSVNWVNGTAPNFEDNREYQGLSMLAVTVDGAVPGSTIKDASYAARYYLNGSQYYDYDYNFKGIKLDDESKFYVWLHSTSYSAYNTPAARPIKIRVGDEIYSGTISQTPKPQIPYDNTGTLSLTLEEETNADDVFPLTHLLSVTTGDSLAFGSQPESYSPLAVKDITVKNIGNEPVSDIAAVLSDSEYYEVWTPFPGTVLGVNQSMTMTVRPKNGLGIGVYDGTVAINWDNGTGLNINLSLSVVVRVDAAAPVIDVQPSGGGNYYISDEVTLSVGVAPVASGTLSYKWYRNTVDSTEGGTLAKSVTNNASYQFTASNANNFTGYYYVVVTNTDYSVNGTRTASVTSTSTTYVNIRPAVTEEQLDIVIPSDHVYNDGKSRGITVTAREGYESKIGTITISYYWINPDTDDWELTSVPPEMAGDFSAQIEIANGPEYSSKLLGVTYTIKKATAIASDFNFTLEDTDYDGLPHGYDITTDITAKPHLTAGGTDFATEYLSVYYRDIEGTSYSTAKPTDVGTYEVYVRCTLSSMNNYNTANTQAKYISLGTFSILSIKGDPTAADLEYSIPDSHVYNGSSQGIGDVTANPGVELGIISVYYTGTGETSYPKSADAPVNAGTYTVSAEIAENDGYNAADIVLGTYSIAKATGNFGTPSAIDTTYAVTLTLESLNGQLGAGYAWTGASVPLNAGIGQPFAAAYTDPSGNYEPALGMIAVNVAKAAGTFGTPSAVSQTYTFGLTLADALLQNGYEWENPSINVYAGSGQTFSATFTDSSGNYETAIGDITVNIAKASAPTGLPQTINAVVNKAQNYEFDLAALLPDISGLTGVAYNPVLTTNTDGVLGLLSYTSGDTLVLPVQDIATAGENAIITVTISSGNYADFTVTITVTTIAKTTVEITGLTAADAVYNNTPQQGYTGMAVIMNNGDRVNGIVLEIAYTGTANDGTAWNSTTAPTKAGTYSITFTVPDSNEEFIGKITLNFAIKKVQIVKPTVINSTLVYTGSVQSAGIAENAAYTITDGTATDAGNYTATVALNDAANYEWADDTTTNLTLDWSIAKANISAPAGLTATYGETLADVTLPTGWTWVDALATSVGNAGVRTFKANYTPSDAANYNALVNIDVTVTVEKAPTETTVPSPTEVTKTTNSITIEAVIVANETVEYAISKTGTAPTSGWQTGLTFENLDDDTTYYVFARVQGDANHTPGVAMVSAAIKTEATPDSGAPIGLIAGIAGGAVVILGGGFAAWWFLIRKKKIV